MHLVLVLVKHGSSIRVRRGEEPLNHWQGGRVHSPSAQNPAQPQQNARSRAAGPARCRGRADVQSGGLARAHGYAMPAAQAGKLPPPPPPSASSLSPRTGVLLGDTRRGSDPARREAGRVLQPPWEPGGVGQCLMQLGKRVTRAQGCSTCLCSNGRAAAAAAPAAAAAAAPAAALPAAAAHGERLGAGHPPSSAPLQWRAARALSACANSTKAMRVVCCVSPSRRRRVTLPAWHRQAAMLTTQGRGRAAEDGAHDHRPTQARPAKPQAGQPPACSAGCSGCPAGTKARAPGARPHRTAARRKPGRRACPPYCRCWLRTRCARSAPPRPCCAA